MDSKDKFGEDYFLRGPETGLSNFKDYRWLPDLTLPMAAVVKRIMGIKDGDSLLDFGAGRGYFVKAMRMLSVKARGYDISEWAVQNCDETVKDVMTNELQVFPNSTDFLWSKDVLEHIESDELSRVLPSLLASVRKKALFIVPLAESDGGKYLNPLDEKDATHVQRRTLLSWINLIQSAAPEMIISGSYRMPTLKASSEHYPHSTGFIQATRY